jgi:hypothetical protein
MSSSGRSGRSAGPGRPHWATPSESGKVSVVSEIAHDVFHGGAGFYLVQIFTTGDPDPGGGFRTPSVGNGTMPTVRTPPTAPAAAAAR